MHLLSVSSSPSQLLVISNIVIIIMYYSTTGVCTTPVVTGTPPPAISYFSLHNLPVPNTGIMFGGVVANGTRRYHTNDTYTVSTGYYWVYIYSTG